MPAMGCFPSGRLWPQLMLEAAALEYIADSAVAAKHTLPLLKLLVSKMLSESSGRFVGDTLLRFSTVACLSLGTPAAMQHFCHKALGCCAQAAVTAADVTSEH